MQDLGDKQSELWGTENRECPMIPFQLPLFRQRVVSVCGLGPSEHSAIPPPTCCLEYACAGLGVPPLATMKTNDNGWKCSLIFCCYTAHNRLYRLRTLHSGCSSSTCPAFASSIRIFALLVCLLGKSSSGISMSSVSQPSSNELSLLTAKQNKRKKSVWLCLTLTVLNTTQRNLKANHYQWTTNQNRQCGNHVTNM